MHDYTSAAEATEEWLAGHFQNIPEDARPRARSGPQMERYARFFTSYLETSFDLYEEDEVPKPLDGCGCCCPCCRYLVNASRLRAKKLTRRDKRRAQSLKRDFLGTLSHRHECGVPVARLDTLAEDVDLSRDLALAAYGNELLRRMQGAYCGAEVLALWRQFAWNSDGSPMHGFQLSADAILDAHRRLVAALEAGAA